MEMVIWSPILFGSLFIAVLALALYLFIPSIRQAEKKATSFRNRPLTEKYAEEIASGDIVIREFDQKKSRIRLICYVLAAALFVVVHQQFQIYIHQMDETCAQLWGMSSFMVQMAYLTVLSILISCILMFIGVKEYRAALKDGYSPHRKSTLSSNIKISYKITKKIKLKMQFGLMMCCVISLLVISLPVNITLILTKSCKHNFYSLSVLNEAYQTECIAHLKHTQIE